MICNKVQFMRKFALIRAQKFYYFLLLLFRFVLRNERQTNKRFSYEIDNDFYSIIIITIPIIS